MVFVFLNSFLIVDTPVAESRWVQMFDGLVDESLLKQEEHDEPAEQSSEHDEGKCIACIHICESISVCLHPVFMLM